MLKKIIPILLSTTLLFTGCSNGNINQNSEKENIKLTYSNLIDDKTQNDIKNILIENKIDKKTSDYFIKLVRAYNEKSEIKNLYTSNNGFTSINVQQVPYDEAELNEKWDYKNNINYMDFNCRITAFTLFKDYIKSNSKFSGDDTTLIFDIDAIENNPLSEFTKEDKDKFINLYGAIKAENTQDIQKHVDEIKKEWKNRKISFIKNKNVSMINVFLHDPEDEILFVGHSGISVKTKDGLLFIEKYGFSLPYQVSKFKDKAELKEYLMEIQRLMDRLDVDTSGNGAAKPIIMENDELMN